MTTVYEHDSMALLCGTRTYRLKKVAVTPKLEYRSSKIAGTAITGLAHNGYTIDVEFDPDAAGEAAIFLRPNTHCFLQLDHGATYSGQLTQIHKVYTASQIFNVTAEVFTNATLPSPFQQAVEEMIEIAEEASR